MKFYGIIDTNVLLLFLIKHDETNTITELIKNKMINENKIIPVFNSTIFNEYKTIIDREKNKYKIKEQDITNILTYIKEYGTKIETKKDYINLLAKDKKKALTDPTDFVFYNITLQTKNDISNDDTYLITGNIKHFPIETFIKKPKEMLDYINKVEEQETFYTNLFYKIRNKSLNKPMPNIKKGTTP